MATIDDQDRSEPGLSRRHIGIHAPLRGSSKNHQQPLLWGLKSDERQPARRNAVATAHRPPAGNVENGGRRSLTEFGAETVEQRDHGEQNGSAQTA